MKRSIILLLSLLWLTASAQYISPFFATMPNNLLPYLSQDNRKDLIDLYKSGKIPKVENLLKGTSQLKVLKEDFISIQLSESSSAELKLLPTSDTTKIIAFIKTVCGKACDSRISFYTSTWVVLNTTEIMPRISVADFVTDSSNEELAKALDVAFITYSFDAESQQLTASLDAKNWLSKADFERFSPYLKNSVVLKWQDGRFVHYFQNKN